jgi:hypothetical protein
MSPAEVAQSVEQGTENPRVGSSILSLGTIIKTGTYELSQAPFFIVSLGNGWEKIFKIG